MPDLVDEVEEELRQERAQALLKKWGGALTALAMLILGGVGGWQGWQWWENSKATAAAAQYLNATRAASEEGADIKAIAERLAGIGNDAPAGYRTLTRLRAAALAAEAGERDRALALWTQVASDSGADQLYRDLGTLMWGMHALEGGNPADIESRMTPLLAGPWRASAREVLALSAIARGNAAEARRRLTELASDDNTPRGIRERAQRLLTGIEG